MTAGVVEAVENVKAIRVMKVIMSVATVLLLK